MEQLDPKQPAESHQNNPEVVPVQEPVTKEVIKANSDDIQKKEEQSKKDEAAIEKVRESLGIVQSERHNNQELVADKIQERVQQEIQKEMGKSLVRLSEEIQHLEDAMRINGFTRIPFNTDELRGSVANELIDFSKAAQAVDDLHTNLRKNFKSENDSGKMSTDPYRFTRVIDSLDSLKGALIGVRNKIDKSPMVDNEKFNALKLSESLTKAINTTRRKMDDLDEAQVVLRRYLDR